MVECEAELIEFKKPLGTSNTLFITGISSKLTQQECSMRLKDIFEVYGLIYDVLVYNKINEAIDSYYAFVKFYSSKAAAKAKAAVHLKYMIDGQLLKVQHPKKGKAIDEANKQLFVEKCYELANYYLGFNGYNASIVSLSKYTEADEKDVASFVCNAKISFRFHDDISSDGIGLGQVAFNPSEIETKIIAVKRAKKMACNRAYGNAFSKVKLVVLSTGKVAPYVDEAASSITSHNLQGIIKINKVDVEEEPLSPEDDINWENTTLLQDINEQLLIDLELDY
ncbi:RAD52 motif-containing protein 1-like isoform X2 [Antedon mediterranea]